ncbi:MAG: hypothetical protein AMJ84_01475 [Acidithiobacillales bacterium SM23_46]|jgi:hypothetical protein|nr:MAG: hypothetical protein AMS22_06030 [Thiotrichales bacterium SG8_50]KPK73859.1 MAG: hypothetical protein AMJ84_01475 [Acidithiobacillales bacterium SM23_46]
MKRPEQTIIALAFAALTLLASSAFAEETQPQLDSVKYAKQLANPVSALISVPMHLNFDNNIGPNDDGSRVTFKILPVIPFSLNKDWNLISRTILPLVKQQDIYPGSGTQSGLSDTVQSLFFSPVNPTSSGWIWGAGPVFLLPTATDDLLGTGKWGAGPTAVALKQEGSWTYGILVNHIWSFAGDSSRENVNSTFLQPFAGYTTASAWSFDLQTESTYNWESGKWNVPLVFLVSKVTTINKQMVQFQGGPYYYVEHFDTGPKGWGLRLAMTLLFPR